MRDAHVVVFPRDYDPLAKKKLSGRQLVLRRVATRRLESVLAPQILLKDGSVPFMAGQVVVAKLRCARLPVWLVVGVARFRAESRQSSRRKVTVHSPSVILRGREKMGTGTSLDAVFTEFV